MRFFPLSAFVALSLLPTVSYARQLPTVPATKPAIEQTTTVPSVDLTKDHILGNKEAPLSLVVYMDFECPFCKIHHTTVKQLIRHYRGRLNVVYRNYPLTSIHPQALPAAVAAECAVAQGGNSAYWRMADALFAADSLDTIDMGKLAADQKLNTTMFAACIADTKNQTAITDHLQPGINGTPTSFLVNNRTGTQLEIDGSLPLEEMEKRIDPLIPSKTPPKKPLPVPPTPSNPVVPATSDKPLIQAVRATEHRYGPADAAITIVEYGGMTEPFSKHFTPDMKKLVAAYPHDVSWVFRHFPLTMLYPSDAVAAEAAECAAAQKGDDGFWAFLFAAHAQEQFDAKEAALAATIDPAALASCIGNHRFGLKIRTALRAADNANIAGAPTSFLINNNTGDIQEIGGAVPFETLDSLVKAALGAAGR